MQLTEFYTRDEDDAKLAKVQQGMQNAKRVKSDELLQSTSKPFYLEPPTRYSRQTELESPILRVLQYSPLPDKFGNSCGEPIIICGCMDGTIAIYSLDTLKFINKFSAHEGAITCLKVFQPEGEPLIVLISAGQDNFVNITIALSGKRVGTLAGHKDAVWSIDVFMQEHAEPWIITGSLDGTIGIWSMLEKKLLRSINGQCGGILKAQLFGAADIWKSLSTGKTDFEIEREALVLASCEDRHLRLWSIQSGVLIIKTEIQPSRITDVVTMIPSDWRYYAEGVQGHLYEKLYQARTSLPLDHKKIIESDPIMKKLGKTKLKTNEAKQEALYKQWSERKNVCLDDVTLIHREALIIASAVDGHVYVYLARTGWLIRVLTDNSFNTEGGMIERSPTYCLQLFCPPSAEMFPPSGGDEANEKINNRFAEDSLNDTVNPMMSHKSFAMPKKKSKGIDLSLSAIASKLTDLDKGVNDQINKGLNKLTKQNFDDDMMIDAAKESAKSIINEVRVMASTKDGSILYWDLGTGALIKKFKKLHDSEQSAISSFVACERSLFSWPDEDEVEDPKRNAIMTLKENSESADKAYKLAKVLTSEYNLPNVYPILVTGGIDKMLKITSYGNDSKFVFECYYSDLAAKVPKDIVATVPRAYHKYPRTYLYAMAHGTLDTFFADQNFNLILVAMR